MRFEGKRVGLVRGIQVAEFVLMCAALYLVFIHAPTERETGVVQKIFYFHVASAWNAFLAFFIIFIVSIGYLLKRTPVLDCTARASCEIGVLFCTITLIAGSLWAKPAWNVWWTWDARLTTTLVLWFVYVAYLILRAAAGESDRTSRSAAVLGIVGFLDVPIVFFSVLWWRTMHTEIIVAPSGGNLAPGMGIALLVSVCAFSFLFLHLLLLRIKVVMLGARAHSLWMRSRR